MFVLKIEQFEPHWEPDVCEDFENCHFFIRSAYDRRKKKLIPLKDTDFSNEFQSGGFCTKLLSPTYVYLGFGF